MKLWIYITFILLIGFASNSDGQEPLHTSIRGYKVPAIVRNGDTIPHITLRLVYVYPKLRFKNKRQERYYYKLVRDVKKTLPIAKEIRNVVIETYEFLETLPDDEAKQRHIKAVEKGLKNLDENGGGKNRQGDDILVITDLGQNGSPIRLHRFNEGDKIHDSLVKHHTAKSYDDARYNQGDDVLHPLMSERMLQIRLLSCDFDAENRQGIVSEIGKVVDGIGDDGKKPHHRTDDDFADKKDKIRYQSKKGTQQSIFLPDFGILDIAIVFHKQFEKDFSHAAPLFDETIIEQMNSATKKPRAGIPEVLVVVPCRLTLGELRSLSGLLETVLLSLDDSAIDSEIAMSPEDRTVLGVGLEKGSGDAEP